MYALYSYVYSTIVHSKKATKHEKYSKQNRKNMLPYAWNIWWRLYFDSLATLTKTVIKITTNLTASLTCNQLYI